jgi:lipopolysaccharide biosynthesis regulator YciM
MSDPVTYALLLAAVLIIGIVGILLFTRAPQRRRPPAGLGPALLALVEGDRPEARRILTDAVRQSESSAEAFLVLGRLLREDGDAERAAGLHRALLARPRLSAANRLSAELELVRDLLALGEAGEALLRLVDLETHFNDPRVLELHARALVADGRLEAAAEVWMKGLRSHRGDDLRRRGVGFLAEVAREYLRLGQPETAERWAKQVLKVDRDNALAHVVLGDVARSRDHDAQARGHYESALEHRGAKWVLPRLIDHSLQQGQVDRLIDALEPIRQDHPDDPELTRAVLDLRIRRGERDEFFALLEAPDIPPFTDPVAWASWVKHIAASEDRADLGRLLDALPAAFKTATWSCGVCGAEEHELRAACLACGAAQALRPHATGDRT